jgi:hypothetical protein
MRARAVVVVMGGGGKDAIITAAINPRHRQQHCHWRLWLNLTTTAINDNHYCCC